jgi:L-fucose mutarotase
VLKGIDPLLSPDLLGVLARMGHGDQLALVDRNYPAASSGRPVVRLDGADLPATARAILSVFPLDTFVAEPVARMEVVGDRDAVPDVQQEAITLAEEAEGRPVGVENLERFAFYARVREAFAVVATSEARPYGCLLLTKGVV